MTSNVQCVILIDEAALSLSKSSPDETELEDSCQLRLGVLRLLCYLQCDRAKSEQSFRWSYKFFNSQETCLQSIEKWGFLDFNLESFEEFEAKIVLKTRRFGEIQEALDRRRAENSFQEATCVPVEALRVAFKQLYADYSWDTPDISSPLKSAKKSFLPEKQENYVWVFSKYSLYLERTVADPFKRLLPKSLYSALSSICRLFWIDTNDQTSIQGPSQRGILSVCSLSGPQAFLPLSSLLGTTIAVSKSKRCSQGSLRLLLPAGRELCRLGLFSPWRLPSNLETLPQEATVRGSVLGSRCMLGTLAVGSLLGWACHDHLASQSPFAGLMQWLHSQGRVLILRLESTKEETEALCVLRPLSRQACALLPLESGATLETLLGARAFPKSMAGRRLFPSVLEKWAVPYVSTCLQGEPLLDRLPKMERRSAQLRVKHQHILTNISRASRASDFQTSGERISSQRKTTPRELTALIERRSISNCSAQPESLGGDEVASDRCDPLCLDLSAFADGAGDREKIFEKLREMYEQSLEGAKSVEIAAEVVARSLNTLAQPDGDLLSLGRREKLLLTAKDIGRKQEVAKDLQKRQREHRLQVLLLLELARLEERGRTLRPCLLQEVVILLRTFSFLAGARELNVFLQDTLKDRYENSLRSFLEDIGEELNVPVFPSSSSSEEEESGMDSQQQAPPSVSSSHNSSVCSSVGGQSSNSSRGRWGRAPSLLSISAGQRQIQVPRNMIVASSHHNNNEKKQQGKDRAVKKRSPVKKRERVRRNLFQKTKSESHISVRSFSQRSPKKEKLLGKSPSHPGYFPGSTVRKSQRQQSKVESSPRTPRVKVRTSSKGFTPDAMFPELVDTPIERASHRSPVRTPKTVGNKPMVGFTPDAKFPELLMESPASCTRSKTAWSPAPLWKTPTSIKRSNSKTRRLSHRSQSASCIRNLNLDLDKTSPNKCSGGTASNDKAGLYGSQNETQRTPDKSSRSPSRKLLPVAKANLFQVSPRRTPRKISASFSQVGSPTRLARVEPVSPSKTPLARNVLRDKLDSPVHGTRVGLNSPSVTPRKSILINRSQDLKVVSPSKSQVGVFSSLSRCVETPTKVHWQSPRRQQSPSRSIASNCRGSETLLPRKRTPSKQISHLEVREGMSPNVIINRNIEDPLRLSPIKLKMFASQDPLTLRKEIDSFMKPIPLSESSELDLSNVLTNVKKTITTQSDKESPKKLLRSEFNQLDFLTKKCTTKRKSNGPVLPKCFLTETDLDVELHNFTNMFNATVQVNDIMLDDNPWTRDSLAIGSKFVCTQSGINGSSKTTFPEKSFGVGISTTTATPLKLSERLFKSNDSPAVHPFDKMVRAQEESFLDTSVLDKVTPGCSLNNRISTIEKKQSGAKVQSSVFHNERENTNPERNSTPKKVCPMSSQCEEASSVRSTPKTSPILSKCWPNKKRKFSPMCSSPAQESFDTGYVRLISPPTKHFLTASRTFRAPSSQSLLHLTTSPVLGLKQDPKSVSTRRNPKVS